MVVDRPSFEFWQNADGVHPDLSPFLLNIIIGQVSCTGDMNPMELAQHAQAGFVKVGHGFRFECLFDGAQSRLDVLLAMRAYLDLGLILCHFDRDRWQVKHLLLCHLLLQLIDSRYGDQEQSDKGFLIKLAELFPGYTLQ